MTPIQYNLTGLSVQDMQMIIGALGNLPHAQVNSLFSKVAHQVDTQNREHSQAAQAIDSMSQGDATKRD